MTDLEERAPNLPFGEFISGIAEELRPFAPMWPFCWLKAVALRHEGNWRLSYFSLSGRWSDQKPIREIARAPGKALFIFSRLIEAQQAWEMLEELAQHTVTLPLGVTAVANPQPHIFQRVELQRRPQWSLPAILTDVEEPTAYWRFLYAQGSAKHVPMNPSNDVLMAEDRTRKAVDAEMRIISKLSFHHFITDHLGEPGRNQLQTEDFFYNFDFPLALRVEQDIPNQRTHQQRLSLFCLPPLSLKGLQMQSGEHYYVSDEAEPIDIEIEPEEAGKWSVGSVNIPYGHPTVWFGTDQFENILPYPLAIPTKEQQVRNALSYLYLPETPEQGLQRWTRHLLDHYGSDFEVAFLNAIARVGIPVLFAGKLAESQAESDQGGGTATPGCDHIALSYEHKLAVLISIKGAKQKESSNKKQGHMPEHPERLKLLDAVGKLQEALPEWGVLGLIVCQVPLSKLKENGWIPRTDVMVWGREHLEWLLQAETREQVERMLGLLPTAQYNPYLGYGDV
jgi:hypothetical protein